MHGATLQVYFSARQLQIYHMRHILHPLDLVLIAPLVLNSALQICMECSCTSDWGGGAGGCRGSTTNEVLPIKWSRSDRSYLNRIDKREPSRESF